MRCQMATEIELKRQKGDVIDSMEKILDLVEAETRDFSTDEHAEYKALEKRLDKIDLDLSAQRVARGKAELAEIVNPARVGAFHAPTTRADNSPRNYRSLFGVDCDASLSSGGFGSLDDFLTPIINRTKDERLEQRAFIAKDGVSGGFSVPEIWTAEIYDKGLESEIIRPRATVYPMTSNVLHAPAWDSGDHQTDGLFGGFDSEWLDENSDGTVQTGKLRTVLLTARKLGIYTEISREAAEDGVSLQSQLSEKLTAAIGFNLDNAFLTGDGVAKPAGILEAASTIDINRQTASQVSYQDLYTMFSRLHPICQENAIWVMHHSVLPQLMNLTVNNNLVFQPVQMFGVSGPVPMTLFGKPIIFTEKTSNLGSKGDVMLFDPKKYAVGLRSDLAIDTSNAPGWTRDVVSLRVILRIDGSPLWNKAVTGKYGGDSLSWSIILDTP